MRCPNILSRIQPRPRGDACLFQQNRLAPLKEFITQQGFLFLLLGDDGTGKTFLLYKIMQEKTLFPDSPCVYVQGVEGLTPANLLKATFSSSQHPTNFLTIHNHLDKLLEYLQNNPQPIWVILDDADYVDIKTLHSILQWLELHIEHALSHLHFILAGRLTLQVTVDDYINSRAIALPIDRQCLLPLERHDIHDYLTHFVIPSYQGEEQQRLLSPTTIVKIHRLSGGIIGKIDQTVRHILQHKEDPSTFQSPLSKTAHPQHRQHNGRCQTMRTVIHLYTRYRSIGLGIGLLSLLSLTSALSYHQGVLSGQSQIISKQLISKKPIAYSRIDLLSKTRPITRPQHSLHPSPYWYTVQILGTHHLHALQRFIQHKHLNTLAHPIAYYHLTYQQSPWFVLTYGHAKTPGDARQLLKELPSSIRHQHLWIRPMHVASFKKNSSTLTHGHQHTHSEKPSRDARVVAMGGLEPPTPAL